MGSMNRGLSTKRVAFCKMAAADEAVSADCVYKRLISGVPSMVETRKRFE